MNASKRSTLLWLDDYFDDFGELESSQSSAMSVSLKADLIEIQRKFPHSDLRSFTTVRGIVDLLTDYARVRAGYRAKYPDTPDSIGAIIIDVMIDATLTFPVPRVDADKRSILFDEEGGCTQERLQTETYNVGIVLAKEFIRKVAVFDRVPVLFYTNRPIDPLVGETADSLKAAGPAFAVNKIGGLQALADRLADKAA